MELTSWLSLIAVCLLGAMSPGPSIAIVIQVTAKGGRLQGIIAAVAHGIGIGCYALLAAAGLAVVIEQSPLLFTGLKLLGAVFLAYLGLKALGLTTAIRGFSGAEHSTSASSTSAASNSPGEQNTTHTSNSFIIGFLTAFLNPKVALFFLALFSQFVSDNAGLIEKLIMAITAAVIDMLWYCLVALAASDKTVAGKFKGYGNFLQKVFGVLLIAIAIRVALN